MLPFTLLRLAFVFTVADLTHAVTLIGTGVASLSVTPDMVALDKILDLWCNNQRLPTFHTRLTLGSTLHDSGIACQLAQRCRTLMARLSSHSRRYIALFHQPYPPKSTQRLSTFDWQRRPTSGSLTVRPPTRQRRGLLGDWTTARLHGLLSRRPKRARHC